MEMNIKTKHLRIKGMTCANCQAKIEKKLRTTAGIQNAEISYSAGTAVITYNADAISLDSICAIIEDLGYTARAGGEQAKQNPGHVAGMLLIIAALFMMLQHCGLLNMLAPSQLASTQMGYGMLFVIGLLTSVHCIAMCGGINLSQCVPHGTNTGSLSAFRPAFLYNLGRVVSYTAVGFAVGALGSAITFTTTMQGTLKLVAGVLMIIMGLNMLGFVPWLHRLIPRMPQAFAKKIYREKEQSNSPLIVGLLNGFMPCGPLQAMQIYALSTGSAVAGALSMFLFSLGTVPLMFGLGFISTALGRKFSRQVMTVGAVLVVVLGLSMLSQGWSLAGGFAPSPAGATAQVAPPETNTGADTATETIIDGVQHINSTMAARYYEPITVQQGIPVKWTLNAPKGMINGCNNAIIIPAYDIQVVLEEGDNIIEFTPTEAGAVGFSCWMGMIRSQITVVAEGEAAK